MFLGLTMRELCRHFGKILLVDKLAEHYHSSISREAVVAFISENTL